MGSYSALWSTPGFVRIISSQLVARFPFGMMTLGFVMHIEQMHDSYAIAGIALGAETIGAAVSGPLLGRSLAKLGVRRVILTSAIIGALAMAAIGIWFLPPPAIIFLALIVGLTSPPIQSAVRTLYPSLVAKKHLNAVYSLDATAQELIWVVGPVMAALLAASNGTGFVVILMAIIQVFGALWFVSNKEISTLKIPKASGKMGKVLKNKVVLSNAIIGLLMVGSFSGIEVGAVAVLDKLSAGIVLAALSVGSILGGLLLGNRAKTRWALTKFLGIIAIGYALFWVNPTDPIWMAICFFIAGLGVAPAFGVLAAIIANTLKTNETAEAYGWISTGQLMGYSAGAALSGIAIDLISETSAMLVSLSFGVAATLVAFMVISITPALGKMGTETGVIKTVATGSIKKVAD
ncbi:MAG: hypothetical protein RI931_425 [Actinomycetota bacterium]|jgi:MFS family permease